MDTQPITYTIVAILIPIVFTILFIPLAWLGLSKKYLNTALQHYENQLEFEANVKTVKGILEGKTEGIIVDVRKKEHYDKGHIPTAVNLPFDQHNGFDTPLNASNLPFSKNQKLFLYCYELYCNLSTKAAIQLERLGYAAREMKGGFDTWKQYKYKIETSNSS